MLNKVGLNTFYGQSFLADICELEDEMLPYTKKYFEELITTGAIKEINPSDIWYECRTDFRESQRGKKLISHSDSKGFELLQGKSVFSGRIFGGCIETLFDMYEGEWYGDSAVLCERYGILPSLKEWGGKILLLESSEMKTEPETYRRALQAIKDRGIFDVINGILVGKPADEVYYDEYKQILTETVNNKNLPIVYNINIGHALPRCIIPFGVNTTVDVEKQKISFE